MVVPVVPVIVSVPLLPIAVVVTEKVAVVAPARTVTEAGTVADPPVAASETVSPPVGAAPLKVTVPVEGDPPATDVGERVSVEITGEVTVRTAVAEVPADVAVMVDVPLSGKVVTVKLAVVAPDGTVTVAGTVAREVLEEVSVMTSPPVPAALVSVTVAVDGDAPLTLAGLRTRLETAGAFTVTWPVTVVLPVVAETVTVWLVAGTVVVAVKLTEVAPLGTVTDPGTASAELFEERVTTVPPEAAAPVKVTVPDVEVPPATVAGENVTASTIAGKMPKAKVLVTPPPVALRFAVILDETT